MILSKKQVIFIACCILLSACATLFDRTNDNVSFTSEPPEASIYLNGRFIGKTPTSVQVSRSLFSGGPPKLAVEKEGYKRQNFELTKEFNKVALFNLTSVYSWTTDVVSGAVMRYSPTDYRIFLEKEHEKEPAADRLQDGMAKFVLFNFERIQEDIAQKGGEHLDSMVVLLGIPANKKEAFLKRIFDEPNYLQADTPSKMTSLFNRDKQF